MAFTQSVKLRRVRSFKITSTLLGGYVHNVAQGPGKVIFLTRGKPLVSNKDEGNLSVSPENLIVWNRQAEFEIDSKLNPVDLLFSSYYLKLCNQKQLIIDADEKGKAKVGLVQFVKKFILPV